MREYNASFVFAHCEAGTGIRMQKFRCRALDTIPLYPQDFSPKAFSDPRHIGGSSIKSIQYIFRMKGIKDGSSFVPFFNKIGNFEK